MAGAHPAPPWRMKAIILSSLTLFNAAFFNGVCLANGILVEESDPIMSESLERQGVPGPAYGRQAQETQKQRQQEPQEAQKIEIQRQELKKLQVQVQALQKQVEKLKKPQKQRQTEQEKKVSRVMIEQGLRSAERAGTIGRYGIMKGTATAKAWKVGDPPEEREVPALQVCATMADLNRMSEQDLAFIGLDPAAAKEVIDARRLLGSFRSSKQLKVVEGVSDKLYDMLDESVIAIEPDRLAE